MCTYHMAQEFTFLGTEHTFGRVELHIDFSKGVECFKDIIREIGLSVAFYENVINICFQVLPNLIPWMLLLLPFDKFPPRSLDRQAFLCSRRYLGLCGMVFCLHCSGPSIFDDSLVGIQEERETQPSSRSPETGKCPWGRLCWYLWNPHTYTWTIRFSHEHMVGDPCLILHLSQNIYLDKFVHLWKKKYASVWGHAPFLLPHRGDVGIDIELVLSNRSGHSQAKTSPLDKSIFFNFCFVSEDKAPPILTTCCGKALFTITDSTSSEAIFGGCLETGLDTCEHSTGYCRTDMRVAMPIGVLNFINPWTIEVTAPNCCMAAEEYIIPRWWAYNNKFQIDCSS